MIEVSNETKIGNGQRLETIGRMLKEIRYSDGRNQDEYSCKRQITMYVFSQIRMYYN